MHRIQTYKVIRGIPLHGTNAMGLHLLFMLALVTET